jgi:peptide/nickel transport system permease protein
MLKYGLRRLGSSLIVVLLVSVITFVVTHIVLPDPVDAVLGGQASSATPSQIAEVRHQLLLDRSIPVQFWDWIRQMVDGDLGRSFLRPQSVSSMITSALPVTIELTVMSLLVAVILGVGLGVLGAARQHKKVDSVTSASAVLLMSVPNFFLGLVFVYIFAVELSIFPSGGYVRLSADPLQNLYHMVLPSLTLASAYIGIFARYTRSLLVRILSEEYITRATAGGFGRIRVVLGHGLRNAAGPIITAIGLNVAGLVGGAVVTESVYSLPGVGMLLTNSILGSDLPTISALVLLITVGVTIITWAVDIVNGMVDPRLRAVTV